MSRKRFGAIAAAIAMGFAPQAMGADGAKPAELKPAIAPAIPCHDNHCNDCGKGGSWLFDLELNFTKFRQSGGVRLFGDEPSPANNAEFDHEFTPRYTIGYVSASGTGARLSYWNYDESTRTVGTGITAPIFDTIAVEATTLDLEMFKKFDVACGIDLEVFSGFRWAELKLRDTTSYNYELDGPGMTFGGKASMDVGGYGRAYLKARTSFILADSALLDDGDLDDDIQSFNDDILVQTEVGVGWESSYEFCSGTVLTYGVGMDIAHWTDAVLAGDDSNEANRYNAGWSGFGFRIGIQY